MCKTIPAPKEQCVEILERAVEIWKNPKKRTRHAWRTLDGEFCVLGSMIQAGAKINGVTWDDYACEGSGQDRVRNRARMDDLAGLLGYPSAKTAININDAGEGPDFLYERMKDALDRAVEAKLRDSKENQDASKA
jgi:hypothetical protein